MSLARRDTWFGCAAFALLGATALAWLHGAGLHSGSKYHTDLTQSPHWMAYHGNAFPADDLLVEYATFNESPLQNAIYWVGTWLVDPVALEKGVGIAIFGLTAALFFGLVSSMSGAWTGTLAALFFIVFPRSAYEIAGGFSKAWATAAVLAAVWVVETRSWRVLLWLMPLAALAYPVAAVLVGAIAAMGLLLDLPQGRAGWLPGIRHLAAASALGVLPLLYKYLTPPDRIGEMIPTARMWEMWETGESSSYTLPLWQEVLSYLEHPFFVYGGVVLLLLLWRRGLVWMRSFSALVLASAVCYPVAHVVVPRLYLPDRYTRFSIAVLLVLWFAHNVARALEALPGNRTRALAVAGVVLFAAASFPETFRPCVGEEDQGLWEDKGDWAAVSAAIAAEPLPVLVAGHPYDTAEIVVQARRPVLVIHRMFHAWFAGYREALDARIRDSFAALYARDPRAANRLAEEYGVTHLVVRKEGFRGANFEHGRLYRVEFTEFIAGLTAGTEPFVLDPPPLHAVAFEDQWFWLVRLPL